MLRILLVLCTLPGFLLAATCKRGTCERGKCYCEYVNAYIGAGYRQDSFNYNVAADNDGGTPNVAREWELDKIEAVPAYGYADYRHPCGFVAKFYGDYARIYDGNATEKQWLGDNRTGLYIENKAWAGRGELWDVGGALGYSIELAKDVWELIPFVGYDHNQTHYRMYDVDQRIGPRPGVLEGQHHSIQALWRGPYVGAEMKAGPWVTQNFWLRVGADYHYMYYSARIKDTMPHPLFNTTARCWREQKAHANGYRVYGGLDYHCTDQWSVGLFANWMNAKTRKGSQFSKCSHPANLAHPLHERKVDLNVVNWHSLMLVATLGYHY